MVKLSFGLVVAGAAAIAVQADNPTNLRGATTGSNVEDNDDDFVVNLTKAIGRGSDVGSKDIYFNMKDWPKKLRKKYTPDQFLMGGSASGSMGIDFDPKYFTSSASDGVALLDDFEKLMGSRHSLDSAKFFGSEDGKVSLKKFVDAFDNSDDDDGSDLEVNLTEALGSDSDDGSKDVYFNMQGWIKAISKKMTVEEFVNKLGNDDSASLGIDFNFDSSDLTSSGSDGSELLDDVAELVGSGSLDLLRLIGSGDGKVSLKAIVDAYDKLRDDSNSSTDQEEAKPTKSVKSKRSSAEKKSYKVSDLDGDQ